jgi:hypothetical protein
MCKSLIIFISELSQFCVCGPWGPLFLKISRIDNFEFAYGSTRNNLFTTAISSVHPSKLIKEYIVIKRGQLIIDKHIRKIKSPTKVIIVNSTAFIAAKVAAVQSRFYVIECNTLLSGNTISRVKSGKHEYLTRNINRIVELVSSISNSCEGNKKGILKKCLKIPVRYREADLNCRPQGYESCALTS